MENGQTKKGLSPLAWVGIGCGAIVLIIILIVVAGGWFIAGKVKDAAANPELAAARMIVRLNPDLEEVSFSEKDGTITFRDKDSGKNITATFADIKDGKFSLTGEEGETIVFESGGEGDNQSVRITSDEGTYEMATGDRSGAVPDWIPVPGDIKTEAHHTMAGNNMESGSFSYVSDLDLNELTDFYKQEFESKGLQTSVFTSSGSDVESARVIGADEAQKQNITVVIDNKGDHRSVGIVYSREL
jgi:hypothetical protein